MPAAAEKTKGEATEKSKNETTYIVLAAHEDGPHVTIIGDVLANGPEQAVRRAVPNDEGQYVAIPARNWTIVKQEAETPPPVISQTVSKWADNPPSIDAPVEEAQEIEEADVEEVGSLTGDGAPRVPAVHPAEAIEDDGA